MSAEPIVTTDGELLDLWLSGRPVATVRAYRQDIAVVLDVLDVPLRLAGLAHLTRVVAALEGADSTRARRVGAFKSLLTFGHRVGYLEENVGRWLPTPRVRSTLHERLLDESQVARVVAGASRPRDRALIRVLYLAGLRIGEAVSLRWSDLGERWITVQGKGAKTRTVLVPSGLVPELRGMRPAGAPNVASVFQSARGAGLSVRQARTIVTKLTDQTLGRPYPPHAFRHTHATVALSRGAPIHLVQQTLGHASLATTSRYLHVRPGQGSSQWLEVG